MDIIYDTYPLGLLAWESLANYLSGQPPGVQKHGILNTYFATQPPPPPPRAKRHE